MNKKLTIIFTIIILSTLILAGCNQTPTGDLIKNQDTIKIGFGTPLTGKTAEVGRQTTQAAIMAVEEINNNRGINRRKIQLIIEDNEFDAAKAVTIFNKFIHVDDIKIIIEIAGNAVLAEGPIADQNKVILFSPVVSNPKVSAAGDFVFRNRESANLHGKIAAEFAAKLLNAKTAAVLHSNDEIGNGYKSNFIQIFENLNGKITVQQAYEKKSSDFRTQLTKIKQKTPDVVFIAGGRGGTIGDILNQAKSLELKTIFIGTAGAESQEMLEVAKYNSEGLYYTFMDFDGNNPKTEKVAKFIRNYELKYNEKPDMHSANTYDAIYILARAISRCGGDQDTDCIRDELYATQNFQGVTGLQSFDENGDVEKEVIMKQIKNGEFVAVT